MSPTSKASKTPRVPQPRTQRQENNRVSQRNYRKRKSDKLAVCEAKVKTLTEHVDALTGQVQTLTADKQKLQSENQALRDKVAHLVSALDEPAFFYPETPTSQKAAPTSPPSFTNELFAAFDTFEEFEPANSASAAASPAGEGSAAFEMLGNGDTFETLYNAFMVDLDKNDAS